MVYNPSQQLFVVYNPFQQDVEGTLGEGRGQRRRIAQDSELFHGWNYSSPRSRLQLGHVVTSIYCTFSVKYNTSHCTMVSLAA